jgi:L-methionine (R)-S-oxide reductase
MRDLTSTEATDLAGYPLMRQQLLALIHGELVLGPFQGKPACVRIAVGRGVCGAAVQRRAAIVVPDVEAFPGHIACDGASRSELVVPLWRDSEVIRVFDLDSPVTARFDDGDRAGIENLLAVRMNHEHH